MTKSSKQRRQILDLFNAKIKSELALWEFDKEHQELEVVTSKSLEPNSSDILISQTPFQGYFISPYAKTFPSTNSLTSATHPIVNLHDVARGHVLVFAFPLSIRRE